MSILFIVAVLFMAGGLGLTLLKSGEAKLFGGVGLALGSVIMAIASVAIIPTGYVGVMRVFGVVQTETLPQGFNVVRPWVTVATRGVRGFQVDQIGQSAMEVITSKGTRFKVDVSIPLRLERTAAAKLDGKQYGDEGSSTLFAEMKEHGLVAVFGASDDLMEFRGAVYDENG